MTFTLPEDLAGQFLRRVPSRDRSRYVAEALREKLRARDRRLMQSCDVANANADVALIEEQWEALTKTDGVMEPWLDNRTR